MLGLVLEGGGAKGAYHIGAAKALKEKGFEFKGISGTSVGALNGALLVQGDLELAWQLWHEISPSRVMRVNEVHLEQLRKMGLNAETLPKFWRYFREIIAEGGIDISPLRALMDEIIDEDRIRAANCDFGIVTISLTARKPLELTLEDIPVGQLIDYLLASASFPGLRMEKLGGQRFIDGGLYDKLPINVLYKRGYRQLITIRTNGPGLHQRVDQTDLDIISIRPRDDLGMILDFDRQLARTNLQLGYYDARRTLEHLPGRRYYFREIENESQCLQWLLAMPEKRVRRIAEVLLMTEEMAYQRMLLERIIPFMAELLSLEAGAGYLDFMIAIMEALADRAKVPRFQIYNQEELQQQILQRHRPPKQSRNAFTLPSTLRRVSLLAAPIREELLNNALHQWALEMKRRSSGLSISQRI